MNLSNPDKSLYLKAVPFWRALKYSIEKSIKSFGL